MGILFGNGLQYLFDSTQRYVRSGLPVYLRVRNFQDTGTYLEVGMPFTPTGTAAFYTGYTDIPITPPPGVQDVSFHNIGIMAGALRFGARTFIISNTWVVAQMTQYNITDPYQVFRDRDGYKAIGIRYDNRLFSLESIVHKEVAGQTINWKITGNATELESDSLSFSP